MICPTRELLCRFFVRRTLDGPCRQPGAEEFERGYSKNAKRARERYNLDDYGHLVNFAEPATPVVSMVVRLLRDVFGNSVGPLACGVRNISGHARNAEQAREVFLTPADTI